MEKINLIELLKYCPAGTKLYSTIYGEVDFIRIDSNFGIIHHVLLRKGSDIFYTISDGRHLHAFDGECTLFPSFECRDWSVTNWAKKPDLPIDTPVMVTYNAEGCWYLRYYAGNSKVFINNHHKSSTTKRPVSWEYIIPCSEFDFENPSSEENIKKSIV